MTYYLDKENNILFIKPNAIVESHVMQDAAKVFKESGVPYQIIILEYRDELVVLQKFKEVINIKPKHIRKTQCLCIKDTRFEEYAGKVYFVYPTHIVSSNGKVFNYVTENGHLLSEEFKNKHFIEWND